MEESKKTFSTIDEYIASFAEPIQKHLQEIREAIHSVAPLATEKISYGMPTFFLVKNLVHFAAFKNHIGFYPTPTGIDAFSEELSHYKGAKGSVQFPLDQPMPIDLIKRITVYRMEENMKPKKK